MMRIFVDFYRYDHVKKRRLLKRLFKYGIVTRAKRLDGYLYTIPSTTELTDDMRRVLCKRKATQRVFT